MAGALAVTLLPQTTISAATLAQVPRVQERQRQQAADSQAGGARQQGIVEAVLQDGTRSACGSDFESHRRSSNEWTLQPEVSSSLQSKNWFQLPNLQLHTTPTSSSEETHPVSLIVDVLSFVQMRAEGGDWQCNLGMPHHKSPPGCAQQYSYPCRDNNQPADYQQCALCWSEQLDSAR